jgi:hypothetical protein
MCLFMSCSDSLFFLLCAPLVQSDEQYSLRDKVKGGAKEDYILASTRAMGRSNSICSL